MSKRSFYRTLSVMSVLIASVCTYGCIASSESSGTEDPAAEAQQEVSSDAWEIDQERPVDTQAVQLECDQAAAMTVEQIDDSAFFAQTIVPEDSSSAKDDDTAQLQSSCLSAGCIPSWCNGQACSFCAGTCWLFKPMKFTGKLGWDFGTSQCYCNAYSNFLTCC